MNKINWSDIFRTTYYGLVAILWGYVFFVKFYEIYFYPCYTYCDTHGIFQCSLKGMFFYAVIGSMVLYTSLKIPDLLGSILREVETK